MCVRVILSLGSPLLKHSHPFNSILHLMFSQIFSNAAEDKGLLTSDHRALLALQAHLNCFSGPEACSHPKQWQKTWNELFPPSPLSTHMLLPHASAHWESNSSSVLHFSQLPQWKKDMVAWRLLQVRDHHTFHLSLEVEAFHHQTNYLWYSHRLSLIDMVDSPVSLSSCLHPLQELSG